MKEKFILWFENGSMIEKWSLDEALSVPYFKFLFKVIPIGKRDNYSRMHYSYEILDNSGKKTIVKIGDYELIDVTDGSPYQNNYNLSFYDVKRSEVFSRHFRGQFTQDFSENVFNFLKKVNEIGSYQAYQKIKELEDLKTKFDELLKQSLEKDRKIEELENKIVKLTTNETEI